MLFAHGASSPEWAEPFRALQAKLCSLRPSVDFELAFLERMPPDFDQGITKLVGKGCRDVLICPLFLARGAHLKRDLPLLACAAEARHPGLRVRHTLAIGESDELIEAIAAWLCAQLPEGS